MVEVYYYVPSDEVATVVGCGLKLSKWFEKEVMIADELRKCLSALLNPKDDIIKYRSNSLKCVKLELLPNYCYIADSCLYQVGLNDPGIMQLYLNSIVPVESYIFGSYRVPECLITSTVIGDSISILDKRLDSPVLFDNSEELYINNIIGIYNEQHSDFNDAMLYNFYCKLTEIGRVDKIEDIIRKIAIFVDKRNGKAFTSRIPHMEKY